MKKPRRFLAMVAALIMLLGMMNAAFAEPWDGAAPYDSAPMERALRATPTSFWDSMVYSSTTGDFNLDRIVAGSAFIDDSGGLWHWGPDVFNHLNAPIKEEPALYSPTLVMTGIAAVDYGPSISFVVKADGSLWGMGPNNTGLLGDGTFEERRVSPVWVMDGVRMASGGLEVSLALKTDGTVWVWGSNYYGLFGNGTYSGPGEYIPAPVQVPGLTGVKAIAAGWHTCFALKEDGSLWGWGENDSGELGIGAPGDHTSPVKIMDNVQAITSENQNCLALKTDGTLWAWGDNYYGQLGDGTKEDRFAPVHIMDDVKAVSTNDHTLAVKTDGTLWAWGDNFFGQLGIGDSSRGERLSPVYVMDGVSAVATGQTFSLALKTDGTAWAWGSGILGLGEGEGKYKSVYPVQILGLPTATKQPSRYAIEAFVRRMYTTCLDRPAEEEGLVYWTNALVNGEATGMQVAELFFFSDEFKGYNLSDEAFMERLYLTLMDRPPDGDGLAYWLSRLEDDWSRESVFAGYVYSDEFAGLCDEAGITLGSYSPPPNAERIRAFVERMYDLCLSRGSDSEGINFWTTQLVSGAFSGAQVAEGFVFSDEMEGKNLSNEAFMTILYNAIMDREPEPGGFAYWAERLNAGGDKREAFRAFVGEPEFGVICEKYGIQR